MTYPTMSDSCTMPPLERHTDDDKAHPRYSEYMDYVYAIRAQLVEPMRFRPWLRDKNRWTA